MFIKRHRLMDAQGGDGGEGGGSVPEGVTMQSLYNENKKYQRLLGKSQSEMATMQKSLDGFGGMQKQMQGLQALFGGTKTPEGEPEPTLYERAMQANAAVMQANPDGGGIPLTVDTARAAQDALSQSTETQKLIKSMQDKITELSNPQFSAESSAFASLDSLMQEAVIDLYGTAELAQPNMPDFERVAVAKMTEIKKDPFLWSKFISRPEVRAKFVADVIASKMPNAYVRRGAEAIDSYSEQDAMNDLMRADKMKDNLGGLRGNLRTKARQRLLTAQTDLTNMA